MDEYMRLLHQLDDLGAGDYPVDVSINVGLPEDVKTLQASLDETLGLEFKLQAGNFYDAAFSGNLYVRKDVYGRECPIADLSDYISAAIMLRFSNFGRLFTIFGCSESILAAYPVEKIVKLATGVGFHYIPVKVLETRYKIVTHNNGQNYKWFNRFFSYP